ncbi:MAG: hypothetical protein PHI27_00020 [Eubacteriales bacterium]|nr:hypothetical protein [Eubacteriales bacterium]MDD3880629.1 hypothetical protein [Eubacteriales bacterium]MDD4513535.1 hypothetical protein [Eubacteriales bacterium]
MTRFIDIHQHSAFDMDDGADDFEHSKRMLRASAADNVGCVFATSHMTPGITPFDYEKYYSAINEMNAFCLSENLPLTVCPGCEVLYTDMTRRFLEEQRIIPLGSSRSVLVEFGQDKSFDYIFDALRRVAAAGYRPVLAHAERYLCLLNKPESVIELKEEIRALIQLNTGAVLRKRSLFSSWDRKEKRFIKFMLDNRIADFVATDAHNTSSRKTRMKECYDFLSEQYGAEYSALLTGGNIGLLSD